MMTESETEDTEGDGLWKDENYLVQDDDRVIDDSSVSIFISIIITLTGDLGDPIIFALVGPQPSFKNPI